MKEIKKHLREKISFRFTYGWGIHEREPLEKVVECIIVEEDTYFITLFVNEPRLNSVEQDENNSSLWGIDFWNQKQCEIYYRKNESTYTIFFDYNEKGKLVKISEGNSLYSTVLYEEKEIDELVNQAIDNFLG